MDDGGYHEYGSSTSNKTLKVYSFIVSALFLAAVVLLALSVADGWGDDDNDSEQSGSPLTKFVYENDTNYKWERSESVINGQGYVAYNIYLTSGVWLTNTDSSTYLQQHWMQVCVPDDLIDPSFAFVWVHGGSMKTFDQPPTSIRSEVELSCMSSRSITIGLGQVPNQPMTFQGDATQQSRTEDAVIAWTWAHFINNTGQPDWLARMPMTRAAVRAMDATQEFWETIRDDQPSINRFVVGGASKRGWTTWMAGSMGDERIVGIVPVVAPIANIVPQLNEQYQSYGFWSWVLYDYFSLGLMGFLNTPVFEEMLEIIDPLFYQDEMKAIPKYQIGGTNDEFFMLDALKWYWDDLPGQKNYRILPNADHGLGTPAQQFDAFQSLSTFLAHFKKGYSFKLPKTSWSISDDGLTIDLTTSASGISNVIVWKSENKEDRDWRAHFCSDDEDPNCLNFDAVWIEDNVTKVKNGKYSFTIDAPLADHYSGFFIEVEYNFGDEEENLPFVVTTDVSVVPKDVYPYDPCAEDVCDCGWDCAPMPPPMPDQKRYNLGLAN